jgi:hypothetical protein
MDEIETRVISMSREVLDPTAMQVVQNDDLRAAIFEQAINQMTANESGAACDHDLS